VKFSCHRIVKYYFKKDIVKAIGITESVVEGKVIYNIESNVLFNLENNILTLTATDGSVWARSRVVLDDAQGSGSVAVYAKKMGSILKEMPDGIISIEVEQNEKINIKSENGKIKHLIIGMKSDDFPSYPTETDGIDYVMLPTKEFVTMINKTIISIAKEALKPSLRGIYFEKTNSKFIAVGTDGRRMALIEREFEGMSDGAYTIIIEPKVLNEILLTANYEDIEHIKMGVDGQQVYFNVGQYDFVSTLIEGKYPNFRQVIPKDFTCSFRVNKNDLLDAIRRVIPMISELRSKRLLLTISDNSLKVKSVNNEVGESLEEIEAKYTGEEYTVGYNYQYLQEIIKQIDSDIITFMVNANNSPTMVKEIEREDYYFIIMPMGLTED
jgi:DNA polymerase-3 subunit beta